MANPNRPGRSHCHRMPRGPNAAVRAIFLSLLSFPLAAQQVMEVSWAEACPSCQIRVDTTLRVPGDVPDAGPLEALWAASRDSEGRLWASFSAAELVHVYDTDGRTLARVGRRGSGPGEYRAVLAVVPIADSVALFDQGLNRITVVGPDLRASRSLPFSGQVLRGVALEWPRVAVNALVPTASSVGYPFHIINIETGEVERSFGGTGRGDFTGRPSEIVGFLAVDPLTGNLWTAMRERFEIQRWSRDGDLLTQFTGLRDRIGPRSGAPIGARSSPPAGSVAALTVGADGLLRLGLQLAASDWRQAWRTVPDRGPGGHPSADEIPSMDQLYRGYLAVLDPDRGEFLATQDLPFARMMSGAGLEGEVLALADAGEFYSDLLVLEIHHRPERRTGELPPEQP